MQGILLLSSAWAQSGDEEEGAEGEPEPEDEPEGEPEAEPEAESEAEPEGGAEGDAEGASGDGEAKQDGADGGEDEEECEEVESGDGGDDIESILDPSAKKCKPKAEGGLGEEPTGSEALAAEVDFLFCWLITPQHQGGNGNL